MADNVTSNAGAGGAVFATDDITSVHYPIGKLGFGALDSVTLAASGAGAVSAGVQRMTLASDDPAVALLGTIDADTSALAGTVAGAELQVDIVSAPTLTVNAHAVTNAGTFAVQVDGAALTALQLIDNPVVVDDAAFTPATTSVMMAGFEFDDTLPDSVDEGDSGAARMSANRNIYTQIRDAAGNERGVNVNASNQLAVSVDNTVTVASHAVTNAGTFAVQVDGNALTALQLIDDTVFAEDAAAQAADKGIAILAVRRDADTSLVGTDNDYANLQVDANGYLKVEIFDGGGSHTVDNGGTFAVQIDAGAVTSLALIDNTIVVDDAAFTPATTSVNMAGFQADETATDSVDEGDAGAARMTLDRKVITTPQPHTAGGLTMFKSIDIDESEEQVKATAGQLYVITAFNTTTAPLYLKFYNDTAANVIVGTTVPDMTFVVPANADGDGAGFVISNDLGWAFSTAITVACTTAVADADAGAPGANACIINLGYK